MSSTLTNPAAPVLTEDYTIVTSEVGYGYNVRLADGTFLVGQDGQRRHFTTLGSARKRISRERRGNFHS